MIFDDAIPNVDMPMIFDDAIPNVDLPVLHCLGFVSLVVAIIWEVTMKQFLIPKLQPKWPLLIRS